MQNEIENLRKVLETQNAEHLEQVCSPRRNSHNQSSALRQNIQLVYQKNTDVQRELDEAKVCFTIFNHY